MGTGPGASAGEDLGVDTGTADAAFADEGEEKIDEDAHDREDAAFEKEAMTYNCKTYLGWRTSYRGEPVEDRLPKVFIARLRKKKNLMMDGGMDASRHLPATSRRRTHDESLRVLELASARQRERKNRTASRWPQKGRGSERNRSGRRWRARAGIELERLRGKKPILLEWGVWGYLDLQEQEGVVASSDKCCRKASVIIEPLLSVFLYLLLLYMPQRSAFSRSCEGANCLWLD